MNVLTATRERTLSWAGHVARMDHKEICAKALRCRGLHWWRWRQLHWKEVETDKWSGPLQTLQVGGHCCCGSVLIHWKCRRFVGICPRKHGLVASSSKPWKLETVFEMWKLPSIDGPGCLGDPCASGMSGTNAGATWSTRKRNVGMVQNW